MLKSSIILNIKNVHLKISTKDLCCFTRILNGAAAPLSGSWNSSYGHLTAAGDASCLAIACVRDRIPHSYIEIAPDAYMCLVYITLFRLQNKHLSCW